MKFIHNISQSLTSWFRFHPTCISSFFKKVMILQGGISCLMHSQQKHNYSTLYVPSYWQWKKLFKLFILKVHCPRLSYILTVPTPKLSHKSCICDSASSLITIEKSWICGNVSLYIITYKECIQNVYLHLLNTHKSEINLKKHSLPCV
jgi:hypothetical protein